MSSNPGVSKPAVIGMTKINGRGILDGAGLGDQQDDSVVVIGQDVGANGGLVRRDRGLPSPVGKDRVQGTQSPRP